MEQKTEAIKVKAKELVKKHGREICIAGMCVCSFGLGREIGRVEGYAKCLVNLIRVAAGAGEAK